MRRTTSLLGLGLALFVASHPVDLFAAESPQSPVTPNAPPTDATPAPTLAAQAGTLAAQIQAQTDAQTDAQQAQTPPGQAQPAQAPPAQVQARAQGAQAQDAPLGDAPPAKAASAEAQPTGPPTPAPPPVSISAGGEIGFYNKYLWRGFVLADAASMQPTYWVKFANTVTVSSWMNVSRQQLEGPLTEHDLTIDYSKTIAEKWTVSGGWINYVFPGLDQASVTNEVYAGVSHASWLNPTVKMYVDFHEGDGTYINFSVNHTFALSSNGFAATPSIALGYNDNQWIDESTWSDLNVGVKLNIPTPISRLSLAPALYYSKALTSAGGLDDHVVGGIGIVTRF